MSDVLVDVNDLVIEFSDRGKVTNRPVRGIDLSIKRGEVLGVVGETGCGKSITAQAILGLLPSGARATGQIVFDGSDLVQESESERAVRRGDIASIVFQNPGTAFNPVFSIGAQMAMVLKRHRGIDGSRAVQLIEAQLDDVGLKDPRRVRQAYPHELSGGMLQRAMIAMALLCEPKLLILDEPTTALDVTVAKQILTLIKRLQIENGFSVLLITHNLGVVQENCDRVAVLYAGKVIEAGTTADVLFKPSHPYTRGLLAAIPTRNAHRLEAISGSVPPNLLGISGCSFAPRCPYAVPECRESEPPLVRKLMGHDVACIRSESL